MSLLSAFGPTIGALSGKPNPHAYLHELSQHALSP